MVVVRHEAPAARKQGLKFQPLLFATLRAACAVREKAAVLDPKIRVLHRSILKGLGAECSALEDAAAAHELRANRGVNPLIGSKINSISQNNALTRALADSWYQITS